VLRLVQHSRGEGFVAAAHSSVPLSDSVGARSRATKRIIIPGVDVVRDGRAEPFLATHPTLSSTLVQWRGITLENYSVPATLISRHEHPQPFLHLVLRGNVEYQIRTKGRDLRFTSHPGTLFVLPRGTVDEINWRGPTQRIAVAIQPRLLTNALDETAHADEVELTEHWNLVDKHLAALLLEMTSDLEDGSPAGRLYGESLASSLAVYLLNRYAVRQITPIAYKGGLPGYRLKRVLDFIADKLEEDITLSQLAAIAGMSPHYFSQLFKQSTGRAPHHYVLLKRIERAKEQLRNPKSSVMDAALGAGFQNPSHFARVFRQLVGTTPSRFRSDYVGLAAHAFPL
jgi:AraC family transcriptional regulator